MISMEYTIFDMLTSLWFSEVVFDTNEQIISVPHSEEFKQYRSIHSWNYKNLFVENGISWKSLLKAILKDSYERYRRENVNMRKPIIATLRGKIEQAFREEKWYKKLGLIRYSLKELSTGRKSVYMQYDQTYIYDTLFWFLYILSKNKFLITERVIYKDWIFTLYINLSAKLRKSLNCWETDIFLQDHETRVHTFKYTPDGILINGFLWTMTGDNLPDRFFRLVCRYFALNYRHSNKVDIEELKKYNLPEFWILNEQLKSENIRKNYIPKINEKYREHYNNRYLRKVKILDIHSSFIKAKRPSIGWLGSMRDLFTS